MKNILLVGNTSWSMYNFRKGLMVRLLEEGYSVSVISNFDEFSKKIEDIGVKFIPMDIHSKSINPIKDIVFLINLYKIYKKEKPDFIFHYTIKPNIYGSLVAKKLKIAQISITTGLGYAFTHKNLISRIVLNLYRISLKTAKMVWFLNTDDRDAFIENKIVSKDKSFVLNGEGIDLEVFNYSKIVEKPDISFLLIARMLWDKGVGEFVSAARILKEEYRNVSFNLLGPIGIDNPSAIKESIIKGWHQEGTIKYLGVTDNVIPFIKEATTVVLPSYYREGVPRSLMEAASMGVPIITTNNVGCKEVVNNGVSGLLCTVKDVNSLVEMMKKMINMSHMDRVEMGRQGRVKMENEFDEKIVLKIYINTLSTYLQ